MKIPHCFVEKALKRSLLILLSFILLQNCIAQSCSDTARKIDYSAPGYRLTLQQHIISNDITFLAGVWKDTSTSNIGVYVLKTSPNGNPGFCKKIIANYNAAEHNCNGLLSLKNGNTLLSIGQVAALGSADTTFELIMLDNAGNIIWKKEYADFLYSAMSVKKVTETEDGNLILMLNFYDNNPLYEVNNAKAALIKMDNSGNIIWSNYYSLLPDKVLEGLALSTYNNNIYMVGQTYDNNFFMGYPDYEHNFWAAKINQTNGSVVDSKSFLNLRVQKTQYGYTWFPNIYAELIKTNAGNFIFSNKYETSVGYNVHGLEKMIIDSNLNFSNAIFYDYNSMANNVQRIIANAKGETITYATDAEGIYVSKFNSLNQPAREIKIKFPAGGSSQGNPWKPIGLKDKYISVIKTYILAGETHFELNELPDDAPLSDCYGTDSSFIKQVPYPVTEVLHPFLSIVRNIPMQVTDFAATVADLPLTTTFNCLITSNCDSLSVSGQDSICRLNKWYTFATHKNANCNKHVLWQIDSTAILSKEQADDTTINIQFKKNWSGYLYASINSCTLLKDSIKINVLSSPGTINLGKDTSLCNGQQLLLNAKAGFKNYVWQDNSTDSTFTVKHPGLYFVKAKDYCNNIYSDTIDIKYNQATLINLGNDTSICDNQPLDLNAGNSFIKHIWNTGETTQFIQADTAGDYNVSATNSFGCVSTDTIKILNVFPSPIINLNKQNVLCLHQNDTLYAGNGYASYLWKNGESQSRIAVTRPGVYKITVSNNYNCFASDSVDILQIATPPTHFLSADNEICSDDSIDIMPHQSFNEYLWSTGSVKSSIKIDKPGTYWLNVKDKNSCAGSDTIIILQKNCDVHFFVPNAFSPNNDGVNDIFKPIITGKVSDYYFAIYNRFGQMVFSSTTTDTGWNGTLKGKTQNSGVFVWHCRYKIKDKVAKIVNGSVLLIQ